MNQVTRHTPRWLQSDVSGSSDPRFLWPVSRLHREMNRLFSDASRGFGDHSDRQASQRDRHRGAQAARERPAAGTE